WPLMDGAIIPGDLFVQQPWWINLFENPKTVQFIHRMGAYTLLLVAIWHMVTMLRDARGTTHARRAVLMFALILCQAAIGVATLLSQVHLHTALLHQAMA